VDGSDRRFGFPAVAAARPASDRSGSTRSVPSQREKGSPRRARGSRPDDEQRVGGDPAVARRDRVEPAPDGAQGRRADVRLRRQRRRGRLDPLNASRQGSNGHLLHDRPVRRELPRPGSCDCQAISRRQSLLQPPAPDLALVGRRGGRGAAVRPCDPLDRPEGPASALPVPVRRPGRTDDRARQLPRLRRDRLDRRHARLEGSGRRPDGCVGRSAGAGRAPAGSDRPHARRCSARWLDARRGRSAQACRGTPQAGLRARLRAVLRRHRSTARARSWSVPSKGPPTHPVLRRAGGHPGRTTGAQQS
jgi:hypothetical protein